MQRVRRVWSVAVVVVAVLASGCGGAPAPSAPGAIASAGDGSQPAVAQPAPSGIALIGFEETGDPGPAAQKELALVNEVRAGSGFQALIGANGAAAFADLDAAESGAVQPWLAEAAAAIQSGSFPTAANARLIGQLAAAGDRPPAPVPAALDDIDLSLFADTGFTTSALLGLFTDFVERADTGLDGSIQRQERRDEDSNGLHQHLDVGITYVVHVAAGKVSVDIVMTATDRITNSSSGSFVALYTSRSTGHFDVDACPDKDGVAAGTYSFETTHELNDVSGATASQAAGGRTVEAPFRLIDGDNAHLLRIEANLDLGANARGPGSAGGPGPTGPFDWSASQQVPIVMPAGGGSATGSGGPMTVTGTGGEAAAGTMFISSAMAQLFIGEVAKEAETFWRSGKCIDLEPSDDTRSVDPDEEIDLTVEAKGAFTGEEIEKPIEAKFTGTKSVEPANQPVDEPANFHFVAGHEQDEKGTIDLKQVSNRGIGLRQVIYTVKPQKLTAEVKGTFRVAAGQVVYDTTIHLSPIPLAAAEEGTFKGPGTVRWTTTVTLPACKTKTYEGTFGTEVTARVDPTDPDSVLVRWTFEPGQLHTETLVCSGSSFPFTGSTSLGGWTIAGLKDNKVRIDGSADVTTALPLSKQKLTITIKRPKP